MNAWYMALAVALVSLIVVTGCGEKEAAFDPSYHQAETLVALGFDESMSMSGYRRRDTSFVAEVCHLVAATGGVVVVYGIGEPTDTSGLRCVLKPVPRMEENLPLSRKLEAKQRRDVVAAENADRIRLFLGGVQKEIFQQNRSASWTDLLGFFRKIDVLLNEPEYSDFDKYVFCGSDGMQSLNSLDTPARYNFNAERAFILCLSGWKTGNPSDSVETKHFEDPAGFLEYLHKQISSHN